MPKIFQCKICDFTCYKKTNFDVHLTTAKHKILHNPTQKNAEISEKKYICSYCDKSYKHSSTYYAHKKKCNKKDKCEDVNKENTDELSIIHYTNDHELVIHLLKQHTKLQEQIIELCKDKNTNNTNSITTINSINNNNVNSHNKSFNLHFFLNETCKEAMNLTDFVNSIQIQLSELENVGRNGFVEGISNIIIKNLRALDVNQRPIHCSDKKREIIYIRDNNQWFNDSNELPENQKLKKAIKQVVHKNICMIKEWKAKYPDCIYAESRKSDLYNKIVYESMDHNQTNSDKIIKRIAKEMGIIKSNFLKQK